MSDEMKDITTEEVVEVNEATSVAENEVAAENVPAETATNEAPEAKEKKKEKKAKKTDLSVKILLGLTLILIAGVIALIGLQMKQLKATNKKVNAMSAKVEAGFSEVNETLVSMTGVTDRLSKLLDQEEDIAQEDDITIGGEYEIKSTKHISDAYLAGDTKGLSDQEIELIDMAKEVIDSEITDDMTDYEKELAIYEWMCKNIKHDDGVTVAIPTTGEYADNPYGVLYTHKAVCVGYATTFRLFMQMLDIECMVCHDTYRSHSWDIVNLDGGWYYTDIYMDAEGGDLYSNFNMTSDICRQGHDWNEDFFPAGTETTYCYAVQNSVDFKSYKASAQDMRELIESGKSGSLYYLVEGDDATDVVYTLGGLADRIICDYIDSSDLSYEMYANYYNIPIEENKYVLVFHLENYNDDGDDDDWDDDWDDYEIDYEGIDEALDDAFGDFFDVHETYEDYDDFDDWDYDWEYDWDEDVNFGGAKG